MKEQIGLAGWINSKEVKMFRKDTLNTYNPFVIVIGISGLGLLVLLSVVAGPIVADWPSGAGESVDLQRAVAFPEQEAFVREHGSIVKLTGNVEPAGQYEGSLAALTGQVEGISNRARAAWMNETPEGFGSLAQVTSDIVAAPRYQGSLAALTGQMEEASNRRPSAWMGEIPEGFGALVRVTGEISSAPRYGGSLAALTGQMEPVAKFEGSLVELTGAGRAGRMSQSEYEAEFGPIVKITG